MERAIRLAIALCLAGAVLFITALSASAQEIEGGCTAEVNRRTPESMTEDEPLVLDKERRVRALGQAPGSGQEGQTNTDLSVILFGLEVPIESEEGEGTEWGGTSEIPGYLKTLAPGIYRVEAEASGPNWNCAASGYIELEGGPLSVAMGLGVLLAGVGLAMVLGARGSSTPDRVLLARKTGIDDRGAEVRPERAKTAVADLAFLALLAIFFFLAYDEIVDLGESIGFAVPAAAAAGSPRRVWLRGSIVRGFFGGLLLGLGAAILLHQFDVWPLDLMQGLVFPLAVAVASAVRAAIGGAFVVTPPPASDREAVVEPVGGGPSTEAMEVPPERRPTDGV